MTTMSGDKIPIKCSVKYISFSAHTDFKQTTQFIRALKPPHIVSRLNLGYQIQLFIIKSFKIISDSSAWRENGNAKA